MKNLITNEQLKKFQENFNSCDKNLVAQNAVVNNGIIKSARTMKSTVTNTHQYSIEIKTGDITNQKLSGRCWMFAALNVMRLEIMDKLNLETFELSQAYPFFWDKLEKSNHFLENIIDTIDLPLDSREVAFLLTDPLGDGGQWDMFASLIDKYGVVPKTSMPESFSSSQSKYMDNLLTKKLREFAVLIREKSKETNDICLLRSLKEEMLDSIYRILAICLGEPPKTVKLEIKDKDDKFVRINDITPQEFYSKYVDMDMSEYVSLINAPTSDKPYYNTYTVKYLGNVQGGNPVKYLNLPIDELKQAAIKQMKDGKAVWFGSDVGQSSDKETGIMALDIYDFNNLFSTTFPMTKAQRLDYGESLMTHAMVLSGVNLNEDAQPNKWRVENSWGDAHGNKGYFVMSDDWFNEYTYQIVVNKKYLTKKQLELLEKEPIVLKPWDPMGSLAL
ncbi:MAG: C1 family peptidase [Sphaerochaetaceae bacterium]|nr:C1 family peptidase [Sphaerochaetaceae bacterium]